MILKEKHSTYMSTTLLNDSHNACIVGTNVIINRDAFKCVSTLRHEV